MGIEFRRGGRKVSQKDFLRGITEDVLARAMDAGVEKLHGQMASVVDPETGKHAPVFVRKIGTQGWIIQTSGSPAYARALEQRLGLNQGDVQVTNESAKREVQVYLAHAHEDKAIVEPIARGLMQRGIDVWYDTWEIGYGDSLRRKMEAGLGDCTHFIVLLTEASITKPWVNEEIDAGLMNAVEGTAKFIGLRHQLPIGAVSPFLRTRLTPELKSGEDGLDELAGEIQGRSKNADSCQAGHRFRLGLNTGLALTANRCPQGMEARGAPPKVGFRCGAAVALILLPLWVVHFRIEFVEALQLVSLAVADLLAK
jgi:hypothetical protein